MSKTESLNATKPIGIVVATHFEASPILKKFAFRGLGKRMHRATIHGKEVLLCVSGVGRENARRASFKLFQAGVGELVSAGFCGALVSDLHVGDIVTHRLITADVPARTRSERETLTVKTKAVAVDMETQAVIEAGTRCGVPIRTVRVVSDELGEDLTPLFGNDNGFYPLKIAFRLVNPSVWPLAARLRRNSAAASKSLIVALDEFFKQPLAN